MKEYIEDLLDVLSQEDADKFLDTLKVVEQEAKEQTAKEIFAYLEKYRSNKTYDDVVDGKVVKKYYTYDSIRYVIPPKELKKLKKKYLVTFLNKKAHNST